jgi:hypothetical protein
MTGSTSFLPYREEWDGVKMCSRLVNVKILRSGGKHGNLGKANPDGIWRSEAFHLFFRLSGYRVGLRIEFRKFFD